MTAITASSLRIGLEVHVELATRSKMFTRAPSPAHPDHFDAEPNTLADPLVLALPGTLPVLNRHAIELSVRVGLALNCRIATTTRWDRKSYFYPDLPKAYQLSQFDDPLCGEGLVELPPTDEHEPLRVRITRAHLEEDAGKLMHEAPGGRPLDHSIVDYNRAGTPLLEIVTEPDFTSADQTVRFAQWLRRVCRWVGATHGIMQRGHMRFEPNINMTLTLDDGRTVTTPIVEIKNLNSFRSLRAAINAEHRDQPRRFLETGIEHAPGRKSTRGWDDARELTFPQRDKEEADDYRYFPDPDIPTLDLDPAWIDAIRATHPELPHEREARYARDLGLPPKDADALTDDRATSDFFEAVLAETDAPTDPANARAVANLILQTAFKRANERSATVDALGLTPTQGAGIVALRNAEEIGSSSVEPLFLALCESDETARDAAQRLDLIQVRDDGALEAWCRAVIDDPANAASIADLRAGKQAAIGRLIGGVMQRSAGRADAKAARAKLLELLDD